MNESTSFGEFLLRQLGALVAPDSLLQLGLVIASGLVAWLVDRRILTRLAERPSDVAAAGWRHTGRHALELIAFPALTLLLVLIARGVLSRLQDTTPVLDVTVILLASLIAIRVAVYLLRKGMGPSPTLKAWENAIGLTVWGLVALHLIGWLGELTDALDALAITLGQTRLSLLTLVKLALSVGVFLLVALWLARLIERRLEASPQLDAGTRLGLAKFSRFLLLTLAVLIALNSAGIDLTALTIFGGALGVGLGFGLQRIASNLVSGFILVFDRSIRPGDVVSVGDSMGEVKELRARYVVIRSRDGVETLIPNENLITSQVINWTYSDRKVRVKVPVQISYADDPELAMKLMTHAALANPRVLREPAPSCLLTAFGDSGINLELRLWINDPEEGMASVRSEVFLEIWRAFKSHGITIPFPQRDVTIKSQPAQSQVPR